jgi:hypothetical protein
MRSLITAIALVLFAGVIVFAANENSVVSPVPHLINYQGMLTDALGNPLNGPYNLTFRIYNALSDGTLKWDHTYNSVPVFDGLFNVVLGTDETIDLAFDEPYWLEIQVGADAPLSPRIQLTSVAYAYTAEYALSAGSAPTGGGWVDAGATVRLQTSTDHVGIGTTNPLLNLHVRGDGYGDALLDGTLWGALVMGDYDKGTDLKYFYIRSDGDKFYLGKVNDAFNVWTNSFVMTRDGDVGIGTTGPAEKLSVIGDVGVGSSSTTGSLKIYMNGSANPIVRAENYATHGGLVDLFDEAGNHTFYMEADGNGSGGFFEVMRSASYYGFMVDGNYAGTNEPRVTITGSGQGAYFYMDQPGNGSVLLPTDAISRVEILDEPGVASSKEGVSGITLDGTLQTLLSRTITCPASGYVLVIGTAQPQISHTYGTASSADFGVSASSSALPDNQDNGLMFGTYNPTGTYQFPVTVHGLFSVSSGSNTFYLLAREYSGSFLVYDRQLTLAYFPTAYGTVTSPKLAGEQNIPDENAPKVSSLSLSDIASEKAESEAFNAARIEKELAEMRAQIGALKAEMGKQQGAQNR